MFYDRQGRLIQNILPNHDDRRPKIEICSRNAKPLIVRISRILVPFDRYDVFLGRGNEKDLVAIHWNEFGEYSVRMRSVLCEIRLAPIIGIKNDTYQSSFQVGRRALIFRLPVSRHERESWWERVPDVSDNPGDLRRNLAKMHRV
jgi:hypothetical protein